MNEKIPNSLLEKDNALVSYLDDMLREATADTGLERRCEVIPIDDEVLPQPVVEVEKPEPSEGRDIDLDVSQIDEPINQVALEVAVDESLDPSMVSLAHQFPQPCLMFNVADSFLSIPLVEICSVIKWTEELTHLPHQPEWVLGVLQHRDQQVKIIDSAQVLGIERSAELRPHYILIFGDRNWGMTCDSIDQVDSVSYDDIQWRQNTQDKMTLGTIRESLASLLSSEGIVSNLPTNCDV